MLHSSGLELLLFSAITASARGSISGLMTMRSDGVVGGSCEYANVENGGVDSPAATSPYIGDLASCAADTALYQSGANCGSCYNVSYDGSPATDPGRPGSLIVQIIDSGSAETFDCQRAAFQAITGADTGRFPITYEPVDCITSAGGPVATMLDGDNAFFTKVIFSNLVEGVAEAVLIITPDDGGSPVSFPMRRAVGATWSADGFDLLTGSVSFKLTLHSGNMVTMDQCFQSWPVATNSFCTGAGSGGPTIAPAGVPTTSPTAASTRAPSVNPTITPTMPTAAPTGFLSPSHTVSPTTSPTTSGTCKCLHQQCGGQGYTGSTCCTEGSVCAGSGSWWSCTPAPIPPSNTCSLPWGQCGGVDWNGSTCCAAGYTCTIFGEHYSQCTPKPC